MQILNSRQKVLKKTTDHGPRTTDKKPRINAFFVSGLLTVVCGLSLSGCGPKFTYPAASVPSSVESICRNEYKIEVIARVVGTTAAALYYVDDILDDKGQIPKDIHEKMGQIMQVVTRVSLSTDLAVEFCVVVIRDRANLNELIITRSLDDSKRANSDAIGVEESINRTLFGQGKYQLMPEGESAFVVKEVKTEDFLAEQIAQRIRFSIARDPKESSEDPEDAAQQSLVLVDGVFNRSDSESKFRFSVLSLKTQEPRESILEVMRTANIVLEGYKFEGFDSVEILDYLNRQKLDITKQVLLDLRAKKITEQEILDRYLAESQTIQEAFKLFGFNLTESTVQDNPPLAAATP